MLTEIFLVSTVQEVSHYAANSGGIPTELATYSLSETPYLKAV